MKAYICYYLLLISIAHALDKNAAQDAAEDAAEENAEERAERKSEKSNHMVLLVIGLLILTVLTTWLLKLKSCRFFHETGLCLLYGMVAGAIIRYSGSGIHAKAVFDPEVFFYALLPPIIFYAGYDMKKRYFFRNIGAILTYAFVGTTLSCIIFGGLMYGFIRMFSAETYPGFRFQECLLFGSLISATDPVTILAIFHDLNVEVDLYAIVFGESVMNDAVAIVLYRSILSYTTKIFDGVSFFKSIGIFFGVFGGSFVLGSMMGLGTALLTKLTKIGQYPRLETALFTLMSYSTFLIAEAAGLTGIVTVLFCGIVQAHYTYNNLTPQSQVATKEIFGLVNFLAESFIFSYMGLTVFTFEGHDWDAGFIAWSFLACAISRACNIYPLSYILNWNRTKRIQRNWQHMMWFGGLRGAVAFALAIRNTESAPRRLILTTVLVVAIVTVVFNGGLTTPALAKLGINVNVIVDEPEDIVATPRNNNNNIINNNNNAENSRNTENSRNINTDLTNTDGNGQADLIPTDDNRAWFVRKWHYFDVNYMKPLFTTRAAPVNVNFPKCLCCAALNSCCDIETTSTIGGDDDRRVVEEERERTSEINMKRLLTYL